MTGLPDVVRQQTPPDEDTFRRELGAFLDQELTEEIRRQNPLDRGLGPEGRAFARKLGAKGWLGLGWPIEYGGSGGSLAHEVILVQELARREAYVPNSVARVMAGPVILRHGDEAMKRAFLPRIASGEIELALGYTEPEAGSDLSSMRMRAREEGDCFVISGQKIFQTECHFADYHWLAARTDPETTNHKGISLFVVDQNAPGITIHAMQTLGGERTNTVFYDDVRVSKDRLVGEKNSGFYYMVEAIDYERLMLFQNCRLPPVLGRLVRCARIQERNGKPLTDDVSVRRRLAQMAVEIEAALSLEGRALDLLRNGEPLDFQASICKLFGSELRQRFANFGLDILGNRGRQERFAAGAPLDGELAHLARCSVVDTIGGGTSEIMRNVIARRALGLPRE
jgi:alkylation response protein AidB-like acyl-CoA dehydrogenase